MQAGTFVGTRFYRVRFSARPCGCSCWLVAGFGNALQPSEMRSRKEQFQNICAKASLPSAWAKRARVAPRFSVGALAGEITRLDAIQSGRYGRYDSLRDERLCACPDAGSSDVRAI